MNWNVSQVKPLICTFFLPWGYFLSLPYKKCLLHGTDIWGSPMQYNNKRYLEKLKLPIQVLRKWHFWKCDRVIRNLVLWESENVASKRIFCVFDIHKLCQLSRDWIPKMLSWKSSKYQELHKLAKTQNSESDFTWNQSQWK